MKYVYVVEQGEYSDRGIVGVYDSAEAAMADHPIPKGHPKAAWGLYGSAEPDTMYINGCEWEESKCITRHEVQTLASVQS